MIVISNIVPFRFFDSKVAALKAALSPFPFFRDPLSVLTEYEKYAHIMLTNTKCVQSMFIKHRIYIQMTITNDVSLYSTD